jgi:predicted nucleic acid-binding protein
MAGPRRPGRHTRVREAAEAEYAPEGAAQLTGVLFDSDVIIEILRGRRDVHEKVAALEASGTPTYCTAISWAEVFAGVRPGEETVTERFFAVRGEVILDGRTGRQAGVYLARYGRSHGVELADALVAAAATTSGLRLWTLNRKHYPMSDLVLYEP